MIPDCLVHLGKQEDAIQAYDALIEEWKQKNDPVLEGMIRTRATLFPHPISWLRALLHDKVPYARATTIKVLKDLAGDSAISDIKPLLQDPIPLVRVVAAHALWELGDRSGLRLALALAHSSEILKPAAPNDQTAIMREELIRFLAITRDPAAQLEAIRILVQSRDYQLISLLAYSEELNELEPWCVSYLMPLLDDRRSTEIYGTVARTGKTKKIRVCDIAGGLITEILASKLPAYGSSGVSDEQLDIQITNIKSWWKENHNKYPIPLEAKVAAEQAGLRPGP
jgi:hypothetical protein